jgi:hypothetical protein
MSTFVIETNVVLPRTRQKLPLGDMPARSSMFIQYECAKNSLRYAQVKRVSAYVYNYAKMTDKKFSIAQEVTGIRIYRVS